MNSRLAYNLIKLDRKSWRAPTHARCGFLGFSSDSIDEFLILPVTVQSRLRLLWDALCTHLDEP